MLLHLHPLEARLAQTSALRAVDHLEVARRVAVVSILGPARIGRTLARALPAGSLRFVGPSEWLAVERDTDGEALVDRLGPRLPEDVFLVDQSHGRALFRLSGPNVRRILAKGVAVDLHPAVFVMGQAANLLCGSVVINLCRIGDSDFELIVSRSFAGALLDELLAMGREFDLSTDFASN